MFRNTRAHGNADALSSLPLPTVPAQTQDSTQVSATDGAESPVTAYHIKLWTRRDPELSMVLQFTRHG